MEEMKPCPFCNAPKDDFGGMVPEAFARCVETGTFAMGCSRCNTTGPMMPSMEEAITAWNTRSPEAVTVMREALEAIRERIPESCSTCVEDEIAEICDAALLKVTR